MADQKPWEKYQSQPKPATTSAGAAGPWTKFGAAGAGGSNAISNAGSNNLPAVPSADGSAGAAASPGLTPARTTSHPPMTHMSTTMGPWGRIESVEKGPAPVPENFFQPGINILTGMLNQIEGGMQRTSPNARDYGKPIGEVFEDDAGLPSVSTGKGTYRNLDPTKEIVLIDPATQKPMAYERSRKSDRGALASLGNIITPGTMTSSPITAARTVPERAADLATITKAGIRPTIGQRVGGVVKDLEDKFTSLPIAGKIIAKGQEGAFADLNQAMYDTVLAPIGKQVKLTPGRDAINQVRKTIDQAYSAVKGNITFRPDPALVSDLKKVQSNYQNGAPGIVKLTKENNEQFQSIWDGVIGSEWRAAGGKFQLTGQEFKHVESELNYWIDAYKTSREPANRLLGNALEDSLGALRNSLSRTNPQAAKELEAANAAYARYVRLRDAAGRLGAKNGIFSPSQLQSAVAKMDKSIGKDRFARGQALLQDLSEPAENILGGKVPDSGTAGRIEAMNVPGLLTGIGASIPALMGYSGPARSLLAKLPVNLPYAKLLAQLPPNVANLLHALAQGPAGQPKPQGRTRGGQP